MNNTDQERRALADVTSSYAAFKPPRRVPVAQGAAENLFIKQPGGIPGLWNPEETPYMIEPMNMLSSRRHEAVCFIGPARTGKTAGLLLGWMAHSVVNDPGDMLFIQMTQDKAREFSKTDIDRAIRHSPAVHALMGGRHDDNTHDKMFRHGMWLRIAWPTVSNVSGATYRYVAITDLDRMVNAENVDGEGPLFKLALKRTQTFGSRGMCLVETSPGVEIVDPHWRQATPHEAPGVTGGLGIYNQSDRRRQYWKCPCCDEWFQALPGLDLFKLPAEEVLLEIVREADIEAIATEYNRIICPHCKEPHGPSAKRGMNARGRWLQDGLTLTRKDELIGRPLESTIAGFWMGGVAAQYQSWRSIVLRYLQGLRDYALTNSEETLKTTTTNDQGHPYLSMHLREAAKAASDPSQRREQDLKRYIVPDETRLVIATIDNQGGLSPHFVVQVHAISEGRQKHIVDRYKIETSLRPGVMEGTFAPLDPSKYVEDWDVITEKVLRSTYRTSMEGREIKIMMTVVDTGGEAGATDKAYAWYRKVRKLGFANRIMLIKGRGSKETGTIPMIAESWLGNRNPKEKGDVPVYLLNSNKFKDIVDVGLKRSSVGPGYIHIPTWLNQSFMDELQSEVRNTDGTWTQIRKRNEAFDLLYYCEAACYRLGLEKIDWNNAPDWARPLATNTQVITRAERQEMKAEQPATVERPQQAVVEPQRRGRRVVSSPYLSG